MDGFLIDELDICLNKARFEDLKLSVHHTRSTVSGNSRSSRSYRDLTRQDGHNIHLQHKDRTQLFEVLMRYNQPNHAYKIYSRIFIWLQICMKLGGSKSINRHSLLVDSSLRQSWEKENSPTMQILQTIKPHTHNIVHILD